MPLRWILKPLALASTIAFSTLGLLSTKYKRARFYFRLGLYVSTLGAISVWGVVVSLLASAAGQRFNINYYVARSFYHTCGPQVGIKFDVEGEEHLNGLMTARGGKHQSALLISNHQSFLDILYLGRILPKRSAIMAKQELKWTPLLGQFMTLSGAVFVNRNSRKDAVAALEIAGQDMKKKGVSLWVFPEGTRSSSAEAALLPFKKGAFHLAVQAQVPIVPIVCENYHRLFDGRSRFESGKLKIKVLPPIPTAGLTADDVTSLTESTREMMLGTLREISVSGPTNKRIASGRQHSAEEQQSNISQRGLQEAETLQEKPKSIHLNIGNGHDVDGVKTTERSEDVASRTSRGSGNDSTEDEMDDDAVLLRRPRGQHQPNAA
ncbi:hypothetical protein IAT40_001075 [Kwoniella sp. CBS 6097]